MYIEQLGKIDLTAMYKITSMERMLQNLVLEYEKLADPRLPACSRKSGKLLETCCTIMDLKGVGLTSISSVYGFVKQVSAISQNYYPERYKIFPSHLATSERELIRKLGWASCTSSMLRGVSLVPSAL